MTGSNVNHFLPSAHIESSLQTVVCWKLCIFMQFVAWSRRSICFCFLLFSLYLNDLWCVHTVYIIHTAGCEMVCDYTVLTDVAQTEDWCYASLTRLWGTLKNVNIAMTPISQFTWPHTEIMWSWIMYDSMQCVCRNHFHLIHPTDDFCSLTPTWNKTWLISEIKSLLWLWQQTIVFIRLFWFSLTFALFLLLLACYNENSNLLLCQKY